MKPEIALIYDADCPNAPEARAVLREALERVGLEVEWIEYDRAEPGVSELLVRYGSPTILVGGTDVAGETAKAAAACCRVYADGRALRGVPMIEAIVAAIVRWRATAPETKELR